MGQLKKGGGTGPRSKNGGADKMGKSIRPGRQKNPTGQIPSKPVKLGLMGFKGQDGNKGR